MDHINNKGKKETVVQAVPQVDHNKVMDLKMVEVNLMDLDLDHKVMVRKVDHNHMDLEVMILLQAVPQVVDRNHMDLVRNNKVVHKVMDLVRKILLQVVQLVVDHNHTDLIVVHKAMDLEVMILLQVVQQAVDHNHMVLVAVHKVDHNPMDQEVKILLQVVQLVVDHNHMDLVHNKVVALLKNGLVMVYIIKEVNVLHMKDKNM